LRRGASLRDREWSRRDGEEKVSAIHSVLDSEVMARADSTPVMSVVGDTLYAFLLN
jgi:hypothetical protein